jgi:pyruvate dehydrogenase E1 component beta subunit
VRDTPIAEGIIARRRWARQWSDAQSLDHDDQLALLTLDQMVTTAKMHHMFGGQWSVPMVLRMAAGWGQLSATHSQTLEVLFAHIPGLKVVFPGTPYDSKGMLKAAIRDLDPVIFIEHTSLYGVKGEVPDGDFVVRLLERCQA